MAELDGPEIVALFNSRRSDDRSRAVALALEHPDADALLAQMLEVRTRWPNIAYYLRATHGDAGTVALRKAAIETGPGTLDRRCTALLSLANRSGATATPWLRTALADRNGTIRDYAVIGLAGAGDSSAVEDVEARLAVTSKTPTGSRPSSTVMAVAYLGQHFRDDRERCERIARLIRRYWSQRNSEEREWFATFWPSVGPDRPLEELERPDSAALRTWVRGLFFRPVQDLGI